MTNYSPDARRFYITDVPRPLVPVYAKQKREGDTWSGETQPQNAWGLGASAKRVLVVDDNIDAADALAELFRVLGYAVAVAYGGMTGVQLFREMRPALMLVDIAMPDMDGYSVARTVRAEGARETTLVAVTGFGQESDKERTRAAGFDYHLTKPVDFDTLKEILRKHL